MEQRANFLDEGIDQVKEAWRSVEDEVGKLKATEAKAREMEHAIRHEIHVKLEEDPAFYESLRERLEEIIEERKQERIDAAEQLKLFVEVREKLGAERETAEEIGLTETSYAIYGLLEKARPSKVAEPEPGFDDANKDLDSLLDEAI